MSSHKTPAPSGRFLPPNSHSTQSQTNLQTPASVKQSSKFARSSQPSSKARFSQTPFFKSASVELKDDIETNFEAERSSPSLPSRSRVLSSNRLRDDDSIDLDDDPSSPQLRSGSDPADEGDGNPQSRAQEHISPSSKAYHSVQRSQDGEFSPVSRKRRKISGSDAAFNDTIRISTSPDRSPMPHVSLQIEEQVQKQVKRADHELLSDESSSSLSPVAEPTLPSSRFRLPTSSTTEGPSQFQGFSSLRPQFKPSAHSTAATDATTALPDSFSPSRRRGRRDYIAGGAADTVRNWVLGLTAEGSKSLGVAQQGKARTGTLRLADVAQDRSGRCAVVQSEDGQKWILVGQQGKQASRGNRGEATVSVQAGDSIVMKGAGTTWKLCLPESGLDGRRAHEYSVSALWDFADLNTGRNQM